MGYTSKAMSGNVQDFFNDVQKNLNQKAKLEIDDQLNKQSINDLQRKSVDTILDTDIAASTTVS